MDIWLPSRDQGSYQVVRILVRVGEMLFPEDDGYNLPLDMSPVKLVEDEWARVPGRQITHLSTGLLEPVAEVTVQLRKLLFTESDREAVLAVVEKVIPCLEKQRGHGYEGPGEPAGAYTINQLLIDLYATSPFSQRACIILQVRVTGQVQLSTSLSFGQV